MSKVAFLLSNDFEDSEFRVPFDTLTKAGHTVQVLGEAANTKVTGYHRRESVAIESTVGGHDINEFDALVIPGGYSPDRLRVDAAIVDFVREYCEAGKIIAAVCHGPQLLIEAGVVKGRTLTSWPSVKTDLQNAGALWVDDAVVTDGALITSRKPDDLEAFGAAILEALAPLSAAHLEEQTVAAQRQSERALSQ